ncbi:MAG: patatin-like phospholipase family protein [Brotaphodocola sp.]
MAASVGCHVSGGDTIMNMEVRNMRLQLDINRPYGIVLEGGGAKGAYQIGAWKALREAGVQIKGIAGSSVGALNGAFMCMNDLEHAENLWQNITYSQVMDVEEIPVELLSDWRSLELKEVLTSVVNILKDGGIDIAPLRKLIAENVDEKKIRESDRELFVTTFSVDERKQMVLDVKSLPEDEIEHALLASAYFFAFKNEKLGGKRYMDGGMFNNVPLNVLIEKGYQDIIVIRIYGMGMDTERLVDIPDDVTVHRIAPRQNLGGMLDFDSKRAVRNMNLGYMDAKRMLYGLEGRNYYFDAPQSEAYYFDKMMSELELVKLQIMPFLEEKEQRSLSGYRAFTEHIFPEMAVQLGLKEDWDYKTLYLAILEEWAKKLKLSRMHIYTPDDILQKVQIHMRKLDSFPRL